MPALRNKNGALKVDGSYLSNIVYRAGQSPERDAWFISFFIENHLDYFTNPDKAATDEQVRFMVYTEDDERYYPCSDRMFAAIMNRNDSAFIQKQYNQVLHKILPLIERQIEDAREKAYLESLIFYKFKHETHDEIAIPSRLEKRLMKIYLNRTRIDDPFGCEKKLRNLYAQKVLESPALDQALNYVDPATMQNPHKTISSIKAMIAAEEFRRLTCIGNTPALWEQDLAQTYTFEDYLKIFSQPINGNGLEFLLALLGFGDGLPQQSRNLLWLMDESGQIIMDLALIRLLVSHGHKVIVAVKEGPLFYKVDFPGIQNDPVLHDAFHKATVIEDPKMSKNDLVRTLRGDTPVMVLSDGTSENVNLLLASTTFARAFKEVDAVISRGNDQRRRFFDSHFQFTQDIFNISVDPKEGISIIFKPRHPKAIKFSHQDLEKIAGDIISQMKAARERGMTVIFYSGIIGSIPGKIDMAKKVMSIYVDLLKNQSSMTLIINPSEYYERGMDADDLMYMWEIVQRSGLIDIWRFQTYEDIVSAFQAMNKKIPPEWVGKDATYSTGCTKEMRIALEVQKKHPEMQLIGPSKERFVRRRDYGVGKMYDQCLSGEITC